MTACNLIRFVRSCTCAINTTHSTLFLHYCPWLVSLYLLHDSMVSSDSVASDSVRKKDKMSKRIRRRLSMASSSSVASAPKRNNTDHGYSVPANNSDGLLTTVFGYHGNEIDESESVDVEDISVVKNQSRMDNLRRRRKFPSPIPDLVGNGDEKGLLRKLAAVPLKMDVGFNHRGDKSSGEQPQLNQKVAVSDIEKLAQKVSRLLLLL